MPKWMFDIASLPEEERQNFLEQVRTALALTLAAGGKLVVTRQQQEELNLYNLIVTQDKMTGDETYEAVRATTTAPAPRQAPNTPAL